MKFHLIYSVSFPLKRIFLPAPQAYPASAHSWRHTPQGPFQAFAIVPASVQAGRSALPNVFLSPLAVREAPAFLTDTSACRCVLLHNPQIVQSVKTYTNFSNVTIVIFSFRFRLKITLLSMSCFVR